ncbi:trafficking protein particle complex subunit 14 isoform X2 [Antennarius striatus]|uniref:trafficking protein particle complex subunit 14 isoform X2 n=1 Tax=Antennarius striatus TaxID=241820 RepID=UPI0035B294E6
MEARCEYFMYFPSAPLSSLSDPAEYASLPRRERFYLGETVHFLFVLRSRSAAAPEEPPAAPAWKHLRAQASVCPAESLRKTPEEEEEEEEGDLHHSWSREEEEETGSTDTPGGTPRGHAFRDCPPVLTHSPGRGAEGPVESALMLDNQVVFCLTVSLDKLPANTLKAKVIVTVWRQVEEEDHGFLDLLQLRSPGHFGRDLSSFKAQVSTVLNVLPPLKVQCRQMTVCGKHLTVLKVRNCSCQEEVCVRDLKIIPNYNSSYLPMMPDGSVLIVDNVCHQSAEVTVASFCRMNSQSTRLPSILSALEEQNFMFQLQLQDKSEEESSEGLDVPLVAVVQWCSPAEPSTSIRLARPQLVMTASCAAAVRPLEQVWVKYTLRNRLQDFLSVRLVWNPEAQERGQDPLLGPVVCQSPLSYLGQCRRGSTLSVVVAFQILRTGLFELSQHMKLKLQFRVPGSTPLLEASSPLTNPSSASASFAPRHTELQEGHSLGRSQSFSHQPPSTPHHVRSGSTVECRGSTPPVRSPMGRMPYPPPTYTTVSLDKIAKRDCKVLVLEPVQESHGR